MSVIIEILDDTKDFIVDDVPDYVADVGDFFVDEIVEPKVTPERIVLVNYEDGRHYKLIAVNGKTYFNINDYEKLRVLFGQLLRETQRIKSEGDYDAAEKLVEKYFNNKYKRVFKSLSRFEDWYILHN